MKDTINQIEVIIKEIKETKVIIDLSIDPEFHSSAKLDVESRIRDQIRSGNTDVVDDLESISSSSTSTVSIEMISVNIL